MRTQFETYCKKYYLTTEKVKLKFLDGTNLKLDFKLSPKPTEKIDHNTIKVNTTKEIEEYLDMLNDQSKTKQKTI